MDLARLRRVIHKSTVFPTPAQLQVVQELVKDCVPEEFKDILRLVVCEPLDHGAQAANRWKVIEALIKPHEAHLDQIRDAKIVEALIAANPHDTRTRDLLLKLGFVEKLTTIDIIRSLQRLSRASDEWAHQSEELHSRLKTSDGEVVKFAPEEAAELLSTEFLDVEGQKALLYRVKDNILWNSKVRNPELGSNGMTPFFYAVAANQELAKWLIKSFIVPGQIRVFWNATDETHGFSLLHVAIHGEDRELITLLTTVPEDDKAAELVNARDRTALKKPVIFTAAGSKLYDVVIPLLVERGAKLTDTDSRGRSAPRYIYEEAFVRLTAQLEDNSRRRMTAAEIRVKYPEFFSQLHQRLSGLFSLGFDINQVGDNRSTLLHCAAVNEDLESMRFLINKGANPIAALDDGTTVADLIDMKSNSEFSQQARKIVPEVFGLTSVMKKSFWR